MNKRMFSGSLRAVRFVLILSFLAMPVSMRAMEPSPNDPGAAMLVPATESSTEVPWGSGAEGAEVLVEPPDLAMRTLSLQATAAPALVNGDFESGTLAGWGSYRDGWPGEWMAYSYLTALPVVPPPQGEWAATTWQDGPGMQILYQDIAVPAEGNYQLHMVLYYDNRAGRFLSPETLDHRVGVNQQYRVDLLSPAAPLTSVSSADVLATLFRTMPGDPAMRMATPVDVDLAPFAGQTIRLRFSCVFTLSYFYAGLDDVRLVLQQPVGVAPQRVEGEAMPPGGSLTVTKNVTTPALAPLPDLYFLADTTGSMYSALSNVKKNAAAILAQILLQSAGAQFGVGNYRDFPHDVSAFMHTAAIGGSSAAIAAINGWSASGGWDGPEAQLFALDQIASQGVGWRDGASRIVVWFGDWPGHDPICSSISGLAYDITEESLIAKLVAAQIKVMAISITGGPGLDADPAVGSYDYAPWCATAGLPGQASRIAAATGGLHLSGVSPGQVAEAILAGLHSLPVTVTPQRSGDCSEELSYAFTPATLTVTSGETASFIETVTVRPEATVGVKTCDIDWLIDGVSAGAAFVQGLAVEVHRPVADAGGPYAGDEGSAILLDASQSFDPLVEHAIVAYAWDVDGDGSFELPGMTVAVIFPDNGTYAVGLQVVDSMGASATAVASVTVNNVAPVIDALTVSQYVVPINTAFTVTASFSDPGLLDSHSTACSFGDGGDPHPGLVNPPVGSGTARVSSADTLHIDYALSGVYTVTLQVADKDGDSAAAAATVVAYDPGAGFVSGGGWIDSPPGALGAGFGDPAATGRANFGFFSRYLKGATRPSGQTEFQFQAGRLNFHSNSYEWLVVNQSGSNAQFKGAGTINGSGNYLFMLWAGDAVSDTFRIRIWTEDALGNESVAYDNGTPQPIAGGSILVHTRVK